MESTFDARKWRAAFAEADRLPQEASNLKKRARGRLFERILSAALDEAGLRPRLSYRPKGEEIDGSIWFEGRTILIEAKWTRDPHPASSLYQFRGKVDGKLVGTLGLFISMSGFSTDAVDALVAGKDLNIILADGDDVRAIAEGNLDFREALQIKLRAAGDTGTPFAPVGEVAPRPGVDLIFVEGRFDARLLRVARDAFSSTASGPIVPTAGPLNMVPLMKAVLPAAGGPTRVTMVIDDDSVAGTLRSQIEAALSELEGDMPAVDVVSVDMPLEAAFGLVSPDADRATLRRLRDQSNAEIKQRLANLDVSRQIVAVPPLGKIMSAAGIPVPR